MTWWAVIYLLHIVTATTIIMIRDIIIMISLNESFRQAFTQGFCTFKGSVYFNARLSFSFFLQQRKYICTHLTVIAFHMIVFVHGNNSNGFIRPLERNSRRQMQLKLISPENTPVSCCAQLVGLKDTSKKSIRQCQESLWVWIFYLHTLQSYVFTQPYSHRQAGKNTMPTDQFSEIYNFYSEILCLHLYIFKHVFCTMAPNIRRC